MKEAVFQSAAEMFGDWRDGILSGAPPVLYPAGVGELAAVEFFGPGLVTLLGGPPGAGKSALAMQLLTDALRLTPDLKAIVASVEMPPDVLLERQLARLSGIDLTLIRYRQLAAEHAERIETGLATLEEIAPRLAFVRPPFTLENVAASADEFEAGIILLDYIQRIRAHGEYGDRRGAIDSTMGFLRQFADTGIALLAVAAVGRSKDRNGKSDYSGLNLASFRESSEIEYSCDSAFMLVPNSADDGEPSARVELKHLKARHSECRGLDLTFDRRRQHFTSASPEQPAGDAGGIQSELARLWAATPNGDGAEHGGSA